MNRTPSPLCGILLRLALLAAVVPSAAGAQEQRSRTGAGRAGQAADSAAVAAVVERFHRALAAGDSAGALSLLDPDAVVLESGGVESRASYRSHHLPLDIEVARAVEVRRGPVRVRVRGDVAWATSSSTTRGLFRGRTMNSSGAEMMVLTRSREEWRIAAIHWSSRTR